MLARRFSLPLFALGCLLLSPSFFACAQTKLRGTPMQADSIVENYVCGMPADELAKVFDLPADSVRALLAYAQKRNPPFDREGFPSR
jgi:hypothetical protein